MELAARTATWSPSGAPLPYLRRVAYLVSTGTQYIIPGVAANGIDIWISPESTGAIPGSIGAWNGGSRAYGKIAFMALQNRGWSFMDYPTNVYTYDLTRGLAHVVWRRGVISFRGTDHNCRFTWYDYSALFGATTIQDQTSVTPRSCQIGEVTLYHDDEVVMHLIPVLDLSGRPAFYEDSGAFYYNQGTGEFAWGELTAADASAANGGV